MKLLLINSVCGIGSTGRICSAIADEYKSNGWEVRIAYGRGNVPSHCMDSAIRIGNSLGMLMNALECRCFDNDGLSARNATRRFIKWANEYDPDELWLHNLHGYYINYELLFSWIESRPNMKVKWTLHDCWAVTGHCCYFAKCNKWLSCCGDCPLTKTYPASFTDKSKRNFNKKKEIFSISNPDRVLIYVPSEWLKNIVARSFLGKYRITVNSNTVDSSVFKPVKSDIKTKFGIENKKMILGVASQWTERKGLNSFLTLSKYLPDDYVIFLVGLTKKQISKIGKNMIGITKTSDVEELVRIYSAADLFVNPSSEETFGMTTLEAISCGSQVLVFKDTACEEVAKKYGGLVCENNNNSLIQAVLAYFGEENV